MSRPTRPHARGLASRPRRQLQIEAVQALEQRQLLAPVMSINAQTVTFTPAATPANTNLGSVEIGVGAELATSAAAFTSVSALTFNDAFGGDMVRIQAGPGGDFGKAVYAISRGSGGAAGAINKPGVVYRVDPATGKASIFFDLNSVLNRSAANSLGVETGLVNWYDISFDPEGYFDGKTSMFISSVDRTDPDKNVIFRVGSDGSFLGVFAQFTEGAGSGQFSRSPSSILVPPPEQQQFLRGLIAGDGSSTGTSGFVALYFDANLYRPGTNLNGTALPPGVLSTGLFLGPQTGLTSTSTSIDYSSLVYSAFTNFGDPGGPNGSPAPGLSGVQGLNGELLINNGVGIGSSFTDADSANPDAAAAIITPFRRFQDIDYDKYGYFSYGATVTGAGTGVIPTVAPIPPDYVGNVFVADLATGLTTTVTPVAPLPTTPTVQVPVQSDGTIAVEVNSRGEVVPVFDPVTGVYALNASNFQGGRIVRISPDGTLTNFAENFNTSSRQDSTSFVESTLSISFSADGTTLYAADNDGIWQFKSVLSLAGSSTGTIVGLNDLRSLGVPYDGQDSAVAVVDTGIDQLTPPFRGRIANGYSVFDRGFGNDDPTPATIPNGHGTLIAGAIAQFVPQSTLVPVDVFTPNAIATQGTTSQMLFRGLEWLQKNPLVRDPIRPNHVNRIITTAIGFGTTFSFETEMTAYGLDAYPQVVLGLKGVAHRLRRMGNQPIAAAGQFGIPVGSGQAASTTVGDLKGEPLPAILNEVISVTGTYPFPFLPTSVTPPNDPSQGAIPRPIAPLVISGGVFGIGTGAELAGNAGIVGAGDLIVYADKLLASSNRTWTTDYAAPAVDIPTFRRTFAGGGPGYNVFQEGGTSLSAGVLTGSYAMVASALDYWVDLAQQQDGVTVDAYLNVPVGTRQLAFGSRGLADLSAYANPDGVNSILEWTAVPVEDTPNLTETINPPPLFGLESFRNFARVDVGNAIAAIEGTVAIDFLFKNGYFDTMDQNKDGSLTAAEIQAFVDRAATIGLPEAGAMARQLGGIDTTERFAFQPTAYGEFPDQPDVLQRRFNFFDWAADGQLNGVITVDQYRVLGHNLLPSPDAFTVTDRQRASANQFLVDSHAPRNFYQLKHLLPTFVWVPQSLAKKFQNPRILAWVGRRELPANAAPFYNLFGQGATPTQNTPRRNQNNNPTGGNSTQNPTNPPNNPSGPTTGNNNTGSGSGTGTTGGSQTGTVNTPTTKPTTTDPSQSILDALIALANRNKTTPTTPGAPTPAASTLVASTLAAETTPEATPAAKAPAQEGELPQGGVPASVESGGQVTDEMLAAYSGQAPSQRQSAADAQQALQARREAQMQMRNQRLHQARERAIMAEKLGLNKDQNLWEKVKDSFFGWL